MSGEDEIPIIGDSPSIHAVIQTIQRFAPTGAAVLITGEHGTGKKLLARTIHHLSPRRDKPFVTANCTLPEGIIANELFGHAEGAQTSSRKIGKFEEAHQGTLVLDEIGELHIRIQAEVLRVQQDRKVVRLGDCGSIPIDTRLIATTSRDLKDEVRQNRFRRDLFFRLSVIHIHLPALRDIRSDIPLLATHFLRKYTTELGRDIQGFSEGALKALATYDWPGNTDHLRHTILRAVEWSEGKFISADDLNLPWDDGDNPILV
jgi:two-component system NtrC family response regulator